MESETGLYDFDLTRFLHANRYPSSGQARGHASLENRLIQTIRKWNFAIDREVPEFVLQ
jgi:hypothetical protein